MKSQEGASTGAIQRVKTSIATVKAHSSSAHGILVESTLLIKYIYSFFLLGKLYFEFKIILFTICIYKWGE